MTKNNRNMENKRIMDSKADTSVLYTVATAKRSYIIKPQSYEGAVKAAEIFNNYMKKLNKVVPEECLYHVVEVKVD